MLRAIDLTAVFLTAAAVSAAAAGYGIRVLAAGRARSERTDRAGGSALLGKSVLEFGYWALTPVGRALAGAGVSADALSWTSLALGAGAGAALAGGLFGVACLAAALSGLLDTLDGMVARLTQRSSEAGEVLDAGVDRYAEAFFCCGLVLHFHAHTALALISLVALTGCFMVSYSTAKAEAMGVSPPGGLMRRQERSVYLVAGAAFTALLSPAIDNAVHWGGIDLPIVVALLFVGVLSNLSAIQRMRALAAILRSRDAVDARVARENVTEVPSRV